MSKVGIDDLIYQWRQEGYDGEALKQKIQEEVLDTAKPFILEDVAREELILIKRDIAKEPGILKRILFDENALGYFAAVSDTELQRFIREVEDIDGVKKGWKVDFKAAVKATKKANALPWDPEPATLLSCFNDALDFPCEAAELVMPGGMWKINHDGLFNFDVFAGDYVQVCFAPVILTRRLVDIETNSEKLEIAFLRGGHWRKISSDRSTFADPRRLIGLADQGLPVTSATASDIVRWLSELESANKDKISVAACVERFGWVRHDAFILGNAACHETGNQEITFVTSDNNLKNAIEALQTGGTLEGWVENIKAATAGRPKLALITAAAFVSPMMRIVECDNFFVDIPGRSSSGKTSAAVLALSAWGYCGRNRQSTLFRPVNTTRVGLENQAAAFCDLPLMLDDTHALTVNILSELVYMVCNGIGKTRGQRNGGNQHIKTWRTVAISTGEAALEDCSTWTGARARVLTVRDAWGGSCGNAVRDAVANANEHFGHAGLKFINWLVNNKSLWPEIKQNYRVSAKVLADKCGGNAVAERRAGYFAALYITADIIEKLFGFTWDMLTNENTFNSLFNEMVMTGSDQTTGKLGLDVIRDFINVNWASFEGSADQVPGGKVFGRIAAGEYVAVFGSLLRDELKRQGFNAAAALNELEEKGLIVRRSVRMREDSKKLYCLDWAALHND